MSTPLYFPLAQQAEDMQPGAGAMVQELLGCAWGRKVSDTITGEWEPCMEQAKRVTVIHNPAEGGRVEVELKLCAKHFDYVATITDPHTEEGSVSA